MNLRTRTAVRVERRRTVLGAAVLLAAVAAPAYAAPVEVPLRFDHEFIRQALLAQVYTGPDGRAVLWNDGTGCGFLKLWDPTVSSAGGRLRITTRGAARIGTPIGDTCLAPVQWDGFLEVFETPQLTDEQGVLQFHVVDSNLYDRSWHKGWFTGKVWDLVKTHVHPRLEGVRIDLRAALQDLRELFPLLLVRSDAARIAALLDSVRLTAATVTDSGVTVVLSFTVSPLTAAAVAAPTPEPTLSPEELQRWEVAWQHWDAFLTFVVKQLGSEAAAGDLRQAFAEVLTEARYDLLDALAPPAPGAPDPTRALFLKTWERLTPVVRRSADLLPAGTALRYLSFIAAGDALAAMDKLGPEIGVEISADGLRRLARIVAPQSTEDPLLYTTAVDPELRRVFGFGAPLPAPDLSLEPQAEADGLWRMASGGYMPYAIRALLTPRPAFAVSEGPTAKTLEQWLADPDRIDAYLEAVREVLDAATKASLDGSDLGARYQPVYRHLVLATGWQESCWRQFIRSSSGAITYLRSPVGSTGMMQVNEHVWRGLYDLRGLRWDIHYNSRAGSEILLHYLENYAIARGEDREPGGIDNLARATYAVYNGGPGHLTRYRTKSTKPALKKIDELFWQKYQAVSAGKEMDVAHCLVGGA